MALTVTATETGTGATSPGIALAVRVLTGQASSPIGATADTVTASVPELAITPTGTGSYVYGAIALVGNTTLTATSATTLLQNVNDSTNGWTYGTLRSTGKTTAGTSVTLGSTAPTGVGSNDLGVALCEILAGGTLAEDASTPAAVDSTSAITITTASFTPPAGSLLVAMVSCAGTGATADSLTMKVSDSSGLTWTQRAVAPMVPGGGSKAYDLASVWTAPVPGSAPVTRTSGLLMAMGM